MKIFIDTNVLIDFLTNKRPAHESSMRFLSLALSQNHNFAVNSVSLANADFLLSRYYNVYDFPKRFSLLNKQFSICSMDEKQATNAIHSDWPDFEDALQYESAVAHGCNIIITRDKKGFLKSKITVLNPEEFLDEYQ